MRPLEALGHAGAVRYVAFLLVLAYPAAAEAADSPAGYAATALARPLFRPDRRPPTPAIAPAPPGLGPAPQPRLAGTVSSASGKVAIFAGEGGTAQARGEGGRIGAFEVVLIEPGRVVVAGPDGVAILRPSGPPNAGGDAPPPHGLREAQVQQLLELAQSAR